MITKNPTLSAVRVTGMHGQFDVDVTLKPGLNVLYGQNGRGKTTLLHLIANTLELDFERFQHLHFQEIEIDIDNGSTLKILPAENSETGVRVLLNGQIMHWREEYGDAAKRHREILRNVLGNKPNYLPAFRSILERVKNENYGATLTQSQQQELEKIGANEAKNSRGFEFPAAASRYFGLRREAGYLTAQKTLQCRQWFGAFVPLIRYPSITEVTDRLESEFRDAELEVAALERTMFSDFFVETMRALLSTEESPSEQEVETLVERIRTAVDIEDDTSIDAHSPKVLYQLAESVEEVAAQGARAGAPEKRVLKLYADILERRGTGRKNSFVKLRMFEEAVNKFLDNKTLHIAEARRIGVRTTRTTYVESENKQQYPLTSLSSGERQVLTMLFSASRLGAASGAFLIDEPELSLHIDWQRIVLEELMAQAGGRQIIACTHSPEVGADHMDAVQVFDPSIYNPNGAQSSIDLDDSL